MNATNSSVMYCDLKDFRKTFSLYYDYVSLIICVFGSVTNVLNICVLTTKQMRCPTNMILTALAFANLLVMLEYVPFVFLYNENKEFASHFKYSFAAFIIFHAVFTQAFHFISCCLAVILAIWQYVAVKFPHHNNKWCSSKVTKITIVLTYIFCSVVCIPLNLSLKIYKQYARVDENGKILFNKSLSHANTSNTTIYVTKYESENFRKISAYVYALVIKLIPCVLLTVLSCLLIVELLKAKERRRKLVTPKAEEGQKMRKPSQRFIEKNKQADRTTKMLLVVLLLFLMVEFPQVILGMLNAVIGKDFESGCYQQLGDIVDVLTLINSSINFVLYCAMSKKFRMIFKESFYPYIPCVKVTKETWISLQTVESYV